MSVDVLAAIKPQGNGSADFRASIAAIDIQRLRIAAEHTRLTAERAEMIAEGGSNSDIKKCEDALANLAISRERLDVAEPVQERKLAEALAREADAAKRDKAQVAAEAVQRFNAALASGEYEAAAQKIVALIEMERAAYRALREYASAPRPKQEGVSAHFQAEAIPEVVRVHIGGLARTLENLVRLPSLVPNTPPLAWWLER